MAKEKTGDLPGEGFSRKQIKAIEDAASSYVTIRDKRMKLTEQEVESKANLAEVMHKNNVEVYRFQDGDEMREVVIESGKEKLKVKTVNEEGEVE